MLRVGEAKTQEVEARGVALARTGGIPAPGVLAARADHNPALLLINYVEGSTSHQPAQLDPARLEALGRIAARINRVDPGHAELPAATRPIRLVDFDELRARARPQPLLQAAQQPPQSGLLTRSASYTETYGAATPCGAAPSSLRSSTGTALAWEPQA